MASNLRVDSIVPATGSSVSIGTATGGVNIPCVLTYEDVTNVDSVGVITARSGIRIGATGANTLISGTATGIGIGEDPPDSLLHIGKGTNADDGAVALTIGGSSVNTRQSTITKNNVGSNDRALEIRAATGGSDETIKFFSDATTERLRIGSSGQIGIGGANYGTSGQVLTSQGSGSAVQWASASNPTLAPAFVFMDSQYFTSTPTKMGFNSSTTNDQSSGVTIDRTNKRFTPTVGGVYQVVTSLNFDRGSGGSSIEYKVFQYKNGSEFARNTSFQYSTGITDSLTCHSLMSLNGSGDYVEFYARHNASGNAIMNVQSTFFIITVGA